MTQPSPFHLLLIISGGVAAYKTLELIRLAGREGWRVTVMLTRHGEEFVTPLSMGALGAEAVYTEHHGPDWADHVALARRADLVLVAPATANILAKMAQGIADDLATTTLLVTDRPIWVAPAMNGTMWAHPATRRNVAQLAADGVRFLGPEEGVFACGEEGTGRMSEPADMMAALREYAGRRESKSSSLTGKKALVTAGPTWEAIDPVRVLANRSSGRQGYAIAAALRDAGAEVTLVSGPVAMAPPAGVQHVAVESAQEMLEAAVDALPVDVAVCAAAVSDWRVEGAAAQKLKKKEGGEPPALRLVENPDILKTLAFHAQRPPLVVGFAAETVWDREAAETKRRRKGADWLLVNHVLEDPFGGEENRIRWLAESGMEDWPRMPKTQVAQRLADEIAAFFAASDPVSQGGEGGR